VTSLSFVFPKVAEADEILSVAKMLTFHAEAILTLDARVLAGVLHLSNDRSAVVGIFRCFCKIGIDWDRISAIPLEILVISVFYIEGFTPERNSLEEIAFLRSIQKSAPLVKQIFTVKL
jgi:hypothetical protein